MASASIELPSAIRAWLVGVIERHWPDPASAIAGIPAALPAGEVRSLARGGPFGLYFDGRLDEVEGRMALEVLENSRMSGESYFRVWDDGTVEPLAPAPLSGFSHPADASQAEIDAARDAYFQHNRKAYDLLTERGFFER